MQIATLLLPYSGKFRLSKLLFYLLIVFLPIQTRKIFFSSQSFFFDFHLFYNTLYLYLTDLLFLGLVIVWIFEGIVLSQDTKNGFFKRILNKISHEKIYWLLGIFWLVLATSLVAASKPFLGIYGLIKVLEFMLILAYIRENVRISREILTIFWLILGISVLESSVGILQYVFQSSLGLKFLGEEFLRPGIQGIAEFVSRETVNPLFYLFFPYLRQISDFVINIRAYGTFPHPNVLAGFLYLGFFINLYMIFRYANHRISSNKLKIWTLSISLLIISTGLVVTFSRIIWVVTLISLIIWLGLISVKSHNRSAVGLIIVVLLVSLAVNVFLFGIPIKDRLLNNIEEQRSEASQGFAMDESYAHRQLFNSIALTMIKENPVQGVGLKNFVVQMDRYYPGRLLPFLHQPVHNIYLLIAAEAGIFALLIFLTLLYYIVRHVKRTVLDSPVRYTLLIIFFGFLAVGLFDHYLLSIQQGSLMFWVMMGLLATKKQT